MIRHAKEFSAQKIPFIFDPGQAMPIFDATDLVQLVGQATWIAVNDYEGHMLAEKLGWTLTELCQKIPGGLIVTRGAEGVDIMEHSQTTRVEGVDIGRHLDAQAVDPTGCGDAFRGGLLFGLSRQASLLDSARLGNIMGALKVVHRGAQNHNIDRITVQGLLRDLYPDTASRLII
jgi:adenosine kinase